MATLAPWRFLSFLLSARRFTDEEWAEICIRHDNYLLDPPFCEMACYSVSMDILGLSRVVGSGPNSAWRMLPIVAILALLGYMSCSSKDPVSALIGDLEKAAEARDVNGIEKRLASDFSGQDEISREESLSQLRRYFAAYEKISLDVTNVERSKAGDRVDFRVSFSGQANTAFGLQGLLPSSAVYQFHLRLVDEDGTLKVKKAFWQETPGL